MRFAILVMTDGRDDYLKQCLNSFAFRGGAEFWMHDDTGDADYRARLAATYPLFTQIGDGPRRGFGGAIRRAWSQLLDRSTADYVFHLEQDFQLQAGVVDLDRLAGLLQWRPQLAQVALKRQPWSAEGPGGFMADNPGQYVDRDGWVETARNFTTNPSLYRRDLMTVGWPDEQYSEGKFGFVLKDRGLPWGIPGDEVRFGFLGQVADEPLVDHIGHVRTGTGY